MNRELWRRGLLIGGVYTGLAILLLYWPLFNLPGFIPTVPDGSVSDYYHFHWNYWWIGYAFAHGLPVYETTYVMAPYVNSLGLHTLTPIGWPVWALVTPLLGTAAGMAAVLIALLTVAGICMYGWLRMQGVSRGWALIGGVILETSPLLLNGVYWTNLNIMGWFWLPLLLILWARLITARRRLGWAIALGIGVWGMGLTDPQFFLLTPWVIVPYGLWTLIHAPTNRARSALIGWVGLAGALALLLLIIAGPLLPILTFDTAALAPTPADRAVAAIGFPDCYVWHCGRDHPADARVPVGAVVLPLTTAALVYTLIRRPRAPRVRWLWLTCVPVPLILSAGASITIAGQPIALPYAWLHDALGGMFRYPERFAPAFVIPAVAFAALTFSGQRRFLRPVSVSLLLLILWDAHAFRPVPIAPLPPTFAEHERMAADPVRYVVVDVPTAGMSGEGLVGDSRWPTTQFYGLTHEQRMVNGHISRIDTWHFMWLRDSDPLLSWLGVRRWLEADAAAALLAERIPLWPIGYVVVHEHLLGREAPALTEIYGFLNAQRELLCPAVVEPGAVFYRTRWLTTQPGAAGCASGVPPLTDGAYVVDLGSDTDRAYLGWGWYAPEAFGGITGRWFGGWTLGGQPEPFPAASLHVDVPPGTYTLTLTAQSFETERTVTVTVNDRVIGTLTIAPDALAGYPLTLPADLVGAGQLTIALTPDGFRPPDGSERGLAVLVERVSLRPVSR